MAPTPPWLVALAGRLRPLFDGPFEPTMAIPFLLFSAACLMGCITLLAQGQFNAALALALATAMVEGWSRGRRSFRLKVPAYVLIIVAGAVTLLLRGMR